MDLFVRTTNHIAIGMYERFGYSVYRRVLAYYHTSSRHKDKDKNNDAFGTEKNFIADCRHEKTYEEGQVEEECKGEWTGFPCHSRRNCFLMHMTQKGRVLEEFVDNNNSSTALPF